MSYYNRTIGDHELSPETLMLNYGYSPALSEGAIKCPIFQTSTFVFRSASEGKQFFEWAYGLSAPEEGQKIGLIYSRLNNPNIEILENRLCIYDGAEKAAVFSSGMAAISTTLLALTRPGDVIVYSDPIYGGAKHFLEKVMPGFGIKTIPFPATASPNEIRQIMRQAQTLGPIAAVHIETPANPTNALVDIAALAAQLPEFVQSDRRPLLTVDNTFLGPLWQQPLQHGADLVLYSLTKYVGGHSDLVAGACLGDSDKVAPILAMRTFLGSTLEPHTAWLLMRSLETLAIRMTKASENAAVLADMLHHHPKIQKVLFLGHLDPNSSEGMVYQRQCKNPGSTFSIILNGGEAEAFRFLDALKIIKLAVSLGGTESLASHPATMTHADVSAEDKKTYGIYPNLVRLSIGIEDADDLAVDLIQALKAV